jgi:selenocysteine-specific elongation factor
MNSAFTIGVAGHVDHGKTTLVRTLTGIDTDRKAEEKARGLSIESGVAELTLPGGQTVALIDVPGHTDFLKNTIRGLNSVDLAVLVVAADDGVMPQTREHLEILRFFKAAAGVVVLTKTDLVDEETLEVAELEVNELLSGTFLENRPIFKFTHRKPELGANIVKGLQSAIAHLPTKKHDAPFRLWIDQVRSIPGRGTVVSGTVASGKICCNDEIELLPAGTKTRARSLESHARAVPHAVTGQRVGINLHRVPVSEVHRGMSLAVSEAVAPTYLLNADLRVLPGAKMGIKNRQRVKVYLGTSVTSAMIVLLTGERLEPGDAGLVQIRLMKPAPALPQDAFVICPMNINTVIAGGRVLEIPLEKFRAVKAAFILPPLATLRKTDVEAYVASLLEINRGNLITARGLGLKTGLPQSAFERYINSKVQKGELVYIKGCGAIKHTHWSELKKEIKAVIEEAFRKDPLKKNASLHEVAEGLSHRVDDSLLKIAAETLCRDGEIARHEGGFLLPGAEASLDTHRESLLALLLEYAHHSELTPFSANTFWKLHQSKYDKGEISQLLNFLFSRKKIVRLKDNRFLSLEALEKIKNRVAQAIASRNFITVNDCKELLGYGRWGGTHVLDYLNDIGFTVRRDDKHYLKKDVR